MPIYEYKCRKCKGEFEVFQKIADADMKSCKFCRGPVTKLISRSSFHLQGSGWYVTDYGGKKPKEGKSEAAGGEAKKEVSAPKTTEKD